MGRLDFEEVTTNGMYVTSIARQEEEEREYGYIMRSEVKAREQDEHKQTFDSRRNGKHETSDRLQDRKMIYVEGKGRQSSEI